MDDLVPDIEEETSEKILKIREYEKQGYLFHGSSNPNIDILEPRKAQDIENKSFNTDTAIYASQTPLVCIMGIVRNGFEGLKGDWRLGTNESGQLTAQIPKSWKSYVENSEGTLYVLPSDTFEKSSPKGWQQKSFQSVAPIDRIDLTLNDFLTLGGQVIWKEEN